MASEDFGWTDPGWSEPMTDFGRSLPAETSPVVPGPLPATPALSGVPPTIADRDGRGGFWSDLAGGLGREVSGSPLKSLATGLGIGATGLGIANMATAMGQLRDAQSMQKKGQQAALSAAAPAVQAGQENIRRAQAGQLQPSLEASIEQWTQQAKADIRSKYAQMGQGNSSNLAGEEAKIDLMAKAMRGQLLQGEEQMGVQELQTGASAGVGATQGAGSQQQLLMGLITSANQALGLLQGRQS